MDLTIGEVMHAAAYDDPKALASRTTWMDEDRLLRPWTCRSGLDIPTVLLALQREAELRGLAPAEHRLAGEAQ